MGKISFSTPAHNKLSELFACMDPKAQKRIVVLIAIYPDSPQKNFVWVLRYTNFVIHQNSTGDSAKTALAARNRAREIDDTQKNNNVFWMDLLTIAIRRSRPQLIDLTPNLICRPAL
ncbi:hypothetical protein [Glaciimonas sp. Gout2]|nr:hypothetical protein [Glaciimonas sp. Gout2]